MVKDTINPPELGKAVGYANGIRIGPDSALVFVAGQIGARSGPDGAPTLVSKEFIPQFEAALENVLTVVQAAGARAEHIVELTVFVKDMTAYRKARRQLGDVWKRQMGRYYPAVTLVEVSDLFDAGALVEIRAVAALG